MITRNIITAVVTLLATSVSAREMKLPNLWRYEVTQWEKWCAYPPPAGPCRRHLKCNDATQVCEQGYREIKDSKSSIFALIDANDRKTALGHLSCFVWSAGIDCLNFDTGEVVRSQPNTKDQTLFTLENDMPEVCVTTDRQCGDWITVRLGSSPGLAGLRRYIPKP